MKKLDLSNIEVDLGKLRNDKEINFKERLNFIKFWAEYIRTHSDEEWSKQQNMVIDSQFQ